MEQCEDVFSQWLTAYDSVEQLADPLLKIVKILVSFLISFEIKNIVKFQRFDIVCRLFLSNIFSSEREEKV